MSQRATQISFFIILAAALSITLFFILKPYFGVLFLAGILATSFYPLYEKLSEKFKGRKNLASLAATFLILIFIIIPVIIASAFLLKEAADLYNRIILDSGAQRLISQTNTLLQNFNSFLPSGMADFQVDLSSYLRNVLVWIIGHFDSIFITVFGGLLNFMLLLISLYYLFIFGEKIKEKVVFWSPLPDHHDKEFIGVLKSSVNSVLRGRILISVIQGVFLGAGFYIFGVGSPILWGFIGAMTSLIPVLGTSIIAVPAVVYLFLTGHFGAGIGLLLWSAVIVGLIDNFVSAVFLKGRIKVHPLVVLFSVLGGVELFGAIGFLVGPVAVSALVALMKIYPSIVTYKINQPTGEQT